MPGISYRRATRTYAQAQAAMQAERDSIANPNRAGHCPNCGHPMRVRDLKTENPNSLKPRTPDSQVQRALLLQQPMRKILHGLYMLNGGTAWGWVSVAKMIDATASTIWFAVPTSKGDMIRHIEQQHARAIDQLLSSHAKRPIKSAWVALDVDVPDFQTLFQEHAQVQAGGRASRPSMDTTTNPNPNQEPRCDQSAHHKPPRS